MIPTSTSTTTPFYGKFKRYFDSNNDKNLSIYGKDRYMLKSQKAFIKNLEVQIGLMANMLNSRQSGTLISDIDRNLRDHVNVITLRNGKQLNAPKSQKKKLMKSKKQWKKNKLKIKSQ